MKDTQLIADIEVAARQLMATQGMRIASGNQIASLKRRDLVILNLNDATEEFCATLKTEESRVERDMIKMVKRLPAAAWVEKQPGVGLGGLGRIIGITGDLDNYANPAKFWKILGQHVTSTGTAPRREKGMKLTRTADAAGRHARDEGYDPSTDVKGNSWSNAGRALCFNLGNSIVMVGHGPLRDVYEARKAKVFLRVREGPSNCPFGQTHISKDKKTILQCVKTDEAGKETSIHIEMDAKRVAVKRFLRDLWIVWTHGEAVLEGAI